MHRDRRPRSPWLQLLLALIVIAALGWLIASHRSSGTANPKAPRPDFVWGASIIPYPTGPANPATLTKVLSLAHDLGLRVVRTEIPPGIIGNDAKFAYTDPIVTATQQAGLDLDLIIHWKWAGETDDVLTSQNLDQLAYQRANAVASRYKGRVRYYQLGNEIPSASLKPSWSGASANAYDDAKYAASVRWLKASAAGIRAADPNAKLIATGDWLEYGFYNRALKDGVDLDIIGWDWFDETRSIHQLEDEGQPVDLVQKLQALQKPIWFVEAGYSATTHTEAEQADLDAAFLKDVSSSPVVTGAMVEVLVDQVNNVGTKGEHDGIVSLDLSNPSVVNIGQPKPAYRRIQQLIQQVSGPLKK